MKSFGIPGKSPSNPSTIPANASARGCMDICLRSEPPTLDSEAALVTRIPVDTDMRSAGSCATRPSPTVRAV